MLKNFKRPAKKPSLPTLYLVPEDLYEADECQKKGTMVNDAAWILGRLDVSDLNKDIK